MVQGLLVVVPELQVKGLHRIVVLEADPDRKSYVKWLANGEVESTREVRQRQATLDEEAFSGESKESAEDLVEEEPLDAEEDEESDGEEEDEEDEGDFDLGGTMTTTPLGWGHSGMRTPQVETTLWYRKQRRPRKKKNRMVAMFVGIAVMEIEKEVRLRGG